MPSNLRFSKLCQYIKVRTKATPLIIGQYLFCLILIGYSRISVTRTLASSNLALTRTKIDFNRFKDFYLRNNEGHLKGFQANLKHFSWFPMGKFRPLPQPIRLQLKCTQHYRFFFFRVICSQLPVTRTPDNSNVFPISPEGSSYRDSTVFEKPLYYQGKEFVDKGNLMYSLK